MANSTNCLGIKIIKWEKYNPRKDLKSTSWFRLQNNFSLDPDFFNFDNDEKMIWIEILCQSSRKFCAEFKINVSQIATILKIKENKVLATVETLENIGILEVRNAHVTRALRTRTTTNERTNERNVTNERTNAICTEPKSPEVISAFCADEKISSFIGQCKIKISIQENWLKLYDADFLKREILKAINWCEDNPHKKPKTYWTKFLSGWFERNWEKHRKNIHSKTYSTAQRKQDTMLKMLNEFEEKK